MNEATQKAAAARFHVTQYRHRVLIALVFWFATAELPVLLGRPPVTGRLAVLATLLVCLVLMSRPLETAWGMGWDGLNLLIHPNVEPSQDRRAHYDYLHQNVNYIHNMLYALIMLLLGEIVDLHLDIHRLQKRILMSTPPVEAPVSAEEIEDLGEIELSSDENAQVERARRT